MMGLVAKIVEVTMLGVRSLVKTISFCMNMGGKLHKIRTMMDSLFQKSREKEYI